ncbi:MAG TPA: PAS domain S-box protein [Burkholderiales bacterium]|nr:PAS domain S-box protein [Burkholderiales bacterium]
MPAAVQGLVATNYRVRTGAFLYSALVVGVVLWEWGAGPLAWMLLALQFLAYPHVVYWRARYSPHPPRAELQNLYLDALLLGAWCAGLGFPTWIVFGMTGATTLNAVVNRGLRGLALSLACSAAGAALWIAAGDVDYTPQTSDLVTALCVIGSFGYLAAVGYVVHAQNRRLVAVRDALRRSEDSYRLIAENAADLIAMVDPDCRWLYTSPSYQRVLEPAALEVGADAFRKVHPDDAEQARSAVARAVVNTGPREVAMRLVDKEGRVRQYRTRVQALEGGATPKRVLLVSRDVTDLRESEERVLLAAHALEGMTEAIVITAADGTIITVNRAFCQLTGFKRDDILGQSEKLIRNALQPPEYYDETYAAVLREGYWSGTTWARRKNGSVYREWRSIRAVRDSGGVITHFVTVASEVGAQRPGTESTNPGLRG